MYALQPYAHGLIPARAQSDDVQTLTEPARARSVRPTTVRARSDLIPARAESARAQSDVCTPTVRPSTIPYVHSPTSARPQARTSTVSPPRLWTCTHERDRVAKPWLRSDTVFFKCSTTGQQVRKEIDYMHSFADQVIDEKIADRKENGGVSKTESIGNGKRLALLDMMMKMLDEGKLNKKEMREEVDMFMFAGHDTTATGLMWALYSFGYYDKKFQREVQAELDGVLDGHYEYEVTPEHLSQMETLERFIKESQRLYPAVPAIARMIDEPIIIDGKTVPTGTATTIFMTTLHRDPEQFPNPDEFDPARFLPEAVAKRHPFAFAPFSAGLRNCIGQRYSMMEMKMLLAHILYNFDLECTQTVDDLRPLMAIVYRPSNPMLIKFTRRQKRALSFV